MKRKFKNITIEIEAQRIECVYTTGIIEHKWGLELFDDEIVFSSEGKIKSFNVNEIKEFQFEIDSRGRYPNLQNGAVAYVVLKDNPEPHMLFHLMVAENEIVLASKSLSYELCKEILTRIKEKYNIDCRYRISIDTKKKRNLAHFVILFLLFLMLALFLLTKFSH